MARTNVVKPTACPSSDGFNSGGGGKGPLPPIDWMHLKTGENFARKCTIFALKNFNIFLVEGA